MGAINERIIPLDEMDSFEVADGDPDVRGWHVFGRDGVKVGEVEVKTESQATTNVSTYYKVPNDTKLERL